MIYKVNNLLISLLLQYYFVPAYSLHNHEKKVYLCSMPTKEIYALLTELTRCDYSPLSPIFNYNDCSSIEEYQRKLQRMLLEFKSDLSDMIAAAPNYTAALMQIYKDFVSASEETYYNIPDEMYVRKLEQDSQLDKRNKALKKDFENVTELTKMVAVQKEYMAEAIRLLCSMLPKDAIITTHKSESSTQNDSDWLTIDEAATRFKIPKNNLKDRKWRIKNNFPTHQPNGTYSRVMFNAKDVQEWLNKRKC